MNNQKEYTAIVEGLANYIITQAVELFECDNGELPTTFFDIEDCLHDLTSETVDQSEYMIYTHYHLKIINFCSNDEAYLDCYDSLNGTFDKITATVAYFALEYDVNNAITESAVNEVLEQLKG